MLAVQFSGSWFGWWALLFWAKILLTMAWYRKYISWDCNYCNDLSSESQKQHYVICRRTAVTISGFHSITRTIGRTIQKICTFMIRGTGTSLTTKVWIKKNFHYSFQSGSTLNTILNVCIINTPGVLMCVADRDVSVRRRGVSLHKNIKSSCQIERISLIHRV